MFNIIIFQKPKLSEDTKMGHKVIRLDYFYHCFTKVIRSVNLMNHFPDIVHRITQLISIFETTKIASSPGLFNCNFEFKFILLVLRTNISV